MKIVRSFLALILFIGISLISTGCDDSSSGGGGGGDSTPAPTTYLAAAGIGVSNINTSLTFYTTYFGESYTSVSNHIEARELIDNEFDDLGGYASRELYFTESTGSTLILMNNGTTVTDRPSKLVFYVPDAEIIFDAMKTAGYTTLSDDITTYYGGAVKVGMVYDPDGYIVEIVSVSSSSRSYFGAIGIGVTDLTESRDFYDNDLEMDEDDYMDVDAYDPVDDATEDWMEEYIMKYPSGKGSGVVLMHFYETFSTVISKDYPNKYTTNPIKLILSVESVDELFTGFEDQTLVNNPSAGLALDLDNYTLQVIEQE